MPSNLCTDSMLPVLSDTAQTHGLGALNTASLEQRLSWDLAIRQECLQEILARLVLVLASPVVCCDTHPANNRGSR